MAFVGDFTDNHSWTTRPNCLVLPIGSKSKIGAFLAVALSTADAIMSYLDI